MHTIFNMKNFYTLLFIIALYVLFTILFIDALRAREFIIGLKTIPFLIISIIFFSWISRYFFNRTEHNLPNIKILIILIASIILSLLLQNFIHLKTNISFTDKKFQNPLYEQYIKIAHKNNLDLSFTKTTWIERGPNNYKINTIFNEKSKSIDIIFFGDSSIAWGLIPNVIEQMTDKKVAIYAYESNVLTEKTAKLFNKISEYYLKDDGLAVFSFDNWTKDKDPSFVKISKKECDEIIKWKKNDFINYVKKSEKSIYDKYFSYSAFKKFYDEKSEYLKTQYGLLLRAPSFYEIYLEPMVNPKLAQNKAVNKNNDTKFIRWDRNTITEYNTNFKFKSVHSEVMPKSPMVNKNVEINAQAAFQIFGNKIYMVPLFSNHTHYEISRNMYYTYYQGLGFKLCDLGKFQPKNEAYTMQAASHMGNTGGLMQSILIGKWLKEYYLDNNISTNASLQFDYLKIYKDKFDLLVKVTPPNSIIYLPTQMVNDKVIAYMKDKKRTVITDIKKTVSSFYFLDNTISSKLLIQYQLEPININTLASYLKEYSNDTIILSIKDEGSSHLSTKTRQYLENIGIKINLLKSRGSFAALIDNNNVIIYDINNTSQVNLDISILKKYGINKVLSAGYKYGNKSEIIIDGNNISKQHRGINYAIKTKSGEIISGFVDTYLKDHIGELVIKGIKKNNILEVKSEK